jgi:hypothetical protein
MLFAEHLSNETDVQRCKNALRLPPEHLYSHAMPPDVPADPAALADEIARTAAHLDAAAHRLLACIRAFDASEEWARQGTLTCAHWLTWRIKLDPVTAREKVRVARALGSLRRIDDCLRRGILSYAQVRALTRVATPDNEEVLIDTARGCTGAQLERMCRKLRRAYATTEPEERPDQQRTLTERVLENGMVRLTVVLHPDEAALVIKAIDEARRQIGLTPPAHRAASAEAPGRDRHLIPRPDALVRVAESYLATADGDATARGGDRTQIFVHLEQDPLAPDQTLAASLDDGTRVSAESFRRLSCDAALVAVRPAADGGSAEIGRRTRTISPPLRRALWARDRGCSFPGCDRRSGYLHAHHIQHWAHGGPTTPENTTLLCSLHHRLVHEGGFGLRRGGDGRLLFTGPRGEPILTAPAATALEGEGAAVIARWNEERGLEIDSQTGFPGWDGEVIDYVWAVDAIVGGAPPQCRSAGDGARSS